MEAFSVTWFLFPNSLLILVGLVLPVPFRWRTISVWEQWLSFCETVRDQLHQPNVDKSVVSGGNRPRVLMELADVMGRPLLIIYRVSWECGEVTADLKVASVIPI